jgi:beta-lactamase regulating signal transducer with metallopeptidase domain
MTELGQHPLVQAAGWTLLHFVWQGTIVALVAAAGLRLARPARARYAIGVAALAVMAALPIATLVLETRGFASASLQIPEIVAVRADPVDAGIAGPSPAATAVDVGGPAAGPASWPPMVVALWFTGALIFGVRLAGGWALARSFTARGAAPASDDLQRACAAVARRLGISRLVQVRQSARVAAPVLVGWIRPVIVIPAGALLGLSGAQIEALLAHELAHVRRYDYLVNLLQSAIEVALFYHPAVWWLSRRVRIERERCCDDEVIGVCDRMVYATALSDLAAMATARVALAATDGDLLARVRRILSREEVVMSGTSRWSGVAILGIAASLMVPGALLSAPAGSDAGAGSLEARVLELPDQSSGQQASAADVAKLQRLHEELKARIAELERAIAQTLGKAHAESAQAKDLKATVEAVARMHEAQAHADQQRLKEAVTAAQAASRAQSDRAAYERLHAEFANMQEQLQRAAELRKRDLIAESAYERMKLDFARLQEQLSRMQATSKNQVAHAEELARTVHQLAQAKAKTEAQHAQTQAQHADTAARALHQLMQERQAAVAAGAADRDARDRAAHANDVTDANATIGAGDVLRITIAGEPDFPATYTVTSAGTVRVPFLGALKVQGLTSAQAREAIGRALADKKLGSASQVTVTIVRQGK